MHYHIIHTHFLQSCLISLTFLTYKCSVNVSDLVRLDAVMEEHGLGPNGGTFPSMEEESVLTECSATLLYRVPRKEHGLAS